MDSPPDLHPQFRRVLGASIREAASPVPIGRDGRIRVNYFLDLMTAAHEPNALKCVAKAFAGWIAETGLASDCSAIVTPKRGNVLLGAEVARLVGKPSAFIKPSILFGRWLEGRVSSGDSVVLVDDVASDGELLADSADALERAGVRLQRVMVLVDRKEGDAESYLNRAGIEYSYLIALGDEDLRNLAG